MIYATETIAQTEGGVSLFNRKLDSAITKWQDQGLEVEVQFQTSANNYRLCLAALLVVRKPSS